MTEPTIHKIKTTKTARYFMSGSITNNTKQVWIVLHGYGMNPGIFLQKFKPLFSDHLVFIAPEALNRYYVKGSAGNVGASWMTKEERLDEINDYVNYLDKVTTTLAINPTIELIVLGFSQGASTLARWISKSKFTPTTIIFYAGVFPPDLELSFADNVWKTSKTIVLIGSNDEFYDPQQFINTFKPLESINPAIEFVTFDGKHEIIPEILRTYCK
jgi:predicted esterase